MAIGCIRPTCSGVVSRCQLPPLSPSPKTRCRGERSIFLPRYCSPPFPTPPPISPHHVLIFSFGVTTRLLDLKKKTTGLLFYVSLPLPLQPALPETGFFAFVRARKCFDWFTGAKLSSDHALSPSPSSQLFGFGFGGPLHARRCNAPVIEDGRPFVPPPRPVFLLSTPVSSYSSGTSAWSRGSGNTSVSVAFGVGV